MDFRVGSYLCATRQPVSPPELPRQSLCIAETRQSFWLPKVITNAREQFPGWPVYVCAPLHVLQWLATEVPDIVPVVMSSDAQHSRDTFNQLMYSQQFWDMFETDYVLMFQCDVVFFPNAHKHPVFQHPVHAMYGPVCGRLEPNDFVINGGLSFRNVKAFRRAVTELDPEDQKRFDEDVVFTRYFRQQQEYTLPTMDECMSFAIESFGHPQTAIGMHGTDKGYCPPALMSAALGKSPRRIVDCMMYDGEPILKTRLALLERVVDSFVIVESRVSHSGCAKDLQFPIHFPNGHPKVTYVVIDEFPETPADFGAEYPWVREDSKDAWWKEQYQRDTAKAHVTGPPNTMVMVSDVDELPDPDMVLRLAASTDIDTEPVHLHMPFLVYAPCWLKQETWTRAFACTIQTMPDSLTHQRCSGATSGRVVGHAGWHCSSFFDVETHIRKVNHFAHREHGNEIDPEVIRDRITNGKDPFGRFGMDAQKTDVYAFLNYIV